MKNKFFPISVWYSSGEATPLFSRNIWERDIANIKKLGFNAVRGWVSWAHTEPEPGKFIFDDVDLLMDLAEKNGLRVILQIYLEAAPDWVVHHYPDAKFTTESDHTIYPQASPGLCPDHPGVKEVATRWMVALASHVKDKPAFYGWDVWSEPHTIQWAMPQHLYGSMFCYCRYTVLKFREWLKRKYGTIENLNKAWRIGFGRTFTDWEMVEPPRYNVLHYACDFYDWNLFLMDRLAEILRWKAETVKKVAPESYVTSHAASSCIYSGPIYGSPDDWRMARCSKALDAWGTSYYPKHSGLIKPMDPAERMAGIDAIRSASSAAGKTFWIGEFQCGPGVSGLRVGDPVTPDDMQVWIWSIIARGAKGLNFYHYYPMFIGTESTGFGIVNLDGSVTERAVATGETARKINEYSDLFVEAEPVKAEVAILYNELSYLKVSRYIRRNRSPLISPRDSIIGVYRALFERNIPVDFIHLEDVIQGILRKYKLLYMPFSIMIYPEACKKIAEFVKNGGIVISEARTGWNDETERADKVIPGFGLSEVFCCKERLIREQEKTEIRIIKASISTPLLSLGDRLTGMVYEEALDALPGGEVIAEFPDGSPAIVVGSYGRGKTVFIGSFLGMAYERYRNANNGLLLKGFLKWAGIQAPVEIADIPEEQLVESRVLEGKGFKVLITINYGEREVTPTLKLRVPAREYQTYDMIAEKKVPCEYKDGFLILTTTLKPSGVWVVKIT